MLPLACSCVPPCYGSAAPSGFASSVIPMAGQGMARTLRRFGIEEDERETVRERRRGRRRRICAAVFFFGQISALHSISNGSHWS